MLRRLLHALAASLLLTLASLPAHADMTIEIVGGGANRHVIALPAFAAEAGVNGGITPIVRNDLQRSGAFNVLEHAASVAASVRPRTSWIAFIVSFSCREGWFSAGRGPRPVPAHRRPWWPTGSWSGRRG